MLFCSACVVFLPCLACLGRRLVFFLPPIATSRDDILVRLLHRATVLFLLHIFSTFVAFGIVTRCFPIQSRRFSAMPSTGEAVMGSTEYSATSTPQKPPAAPLVGTSSPRMRMLWAVPAVLGGVLAMLNPVVGQSTTEEAGTDSFWMFLIMSIVLILISGLMSGLTVGTSCAAAVAVVL